MENRPAMKSFTNRLHVETADATVRTYGLQIRTPNLRVPGPYRLSLPPQLGAVPWVRGVGCVGRPWIAYGLRQRIPVLGFRLLPELYCTDTETSLGYSTIPCLQHGIPTNQLSYYLCEVHRGVCFQPCSIYSVHIPKQQARGGRGRAPAASHRKHRFNYVELSDCFLSIR